MILQEAEKRAATVRDALPHNILIDIAARVLYLLTRLAVPPFILSRVTIEAYGLWTTIFVLVSYIGISSMGLSSVNVKYVAEFAATREFERANRLLATGLCFSVPACLVTFGAIWLLLPNLSRLIHVAPSLQSDAHEAILMVVAIFLASLCLSLFRDSLVAVQKTAQVQLIWIAGFLLETLLIFLLVGSGRGIRGLAEAFLIRTLLETGACCYLAFRTLPWLRIDLRLRDKASVQLLFTFGGVVQILSFLAVGLNSIERLLAAPLVGLEAAALLDVAKKFPAMAASVPLAFASSLVPAAAFLQGGAEQSAEQKQTIQKLYYKGARYMSVFAGVLLALPMFLSSTILHVWIGKPLAGAAILMTVFCLSSQVNLLTGPGTSILRGVGRFNEEFYYALPNVGFLLIALPIGRILLHQWTAVGIGFAVALSTILAAIVFLARAHYLLDIPLAGYCRRVLMPGFFPFLIASPFALIAPFVTANLSRWESAGTLAAIGTVYALLVAVAMAKYVFDEGERLWLREILAAKLGLVRV